MPDLMPAAAFGRIPSETIELFRQNITIVRERVIISLPAQADEPLQALTLEKVLDAVFRDWQEHGNTFLSEEDVSDLSSFVQMAAALAGHHQINAQGRAVFEATLSALLEDWLYNWNTEKKEQNTR